MSDDYRRSPLRGIVFAIAPSLILWALIVTAVWAVIR